MNPTASPPPSPAAAGPDAPVGLHLATAPADPTARFAATIRHPARFRAALAAFLEVAPARPTVTAADDAWIIEGFAADQDAYARISVDPAEFADQDDFRAGTAGVAGLETFADSLDRVRDGVPARLRVGPGADPAGPAGSPPRGWLRGFAGFQAALGLPTRRIAVDRGGLFGLITALGPATTGRIGRSIVVGWGPGGPATATVRPGARPVPLHARAHAGGGGPGGSLRVAVGHRLGVLAGLLPWVDAADLLLLGPGLPSFWSARLGGIRFLLGLPSWTPDGRLGALGLDPVEPPAEPARFLANQVVATFRAHPAQTRDQIAGRTRGGVAEVAAVLVHLAAAGHVLPEPEVGLFRWRSIPGEAEAVLDDPEPAEATAARAILRTTSIRVTRDEAAPGGAGRRVEGLILDRPATLDLDADGWMTRGRCTCSHGSAGGLARSGPCRHLLALQARAAGPPPPRPPDLAAWFAGFPLPMPPA